MQREPDLTGFVENGQIPDLPLGPKSGISLTANNHHHHNRFTALFQDHPGEPVPEVLV